MQVDLSPRRDAASSALPPYDGLLPTPSTAELRPTPTNQVTHHTHPVSMDTPADTPHDLFCLAKEYERRGRKPDAANLYLKASMNGHLSAMVSYANHLVASDERAAFVWFRAAAERGDPRAWAELGQLLARGRYFEVNAIDAARCWKRAAQMGDNTGKSALGLCYIRGFGVKQDPEKGVEIVRQVADVHNDVTAMKNLAWIYRHGKGVPKNLEAADYWEKRAKEQESVLVRISSREHVLFGRGRSSRHSKCRSREERASARTIIRDTEKPPVYGQEQTTKPLLRDAHATILEEQDLQNRLKGISEDPSRHSPESLEHKTGEVTAIADTDHVESRPIESEVSEEAGPASTDAKPAPEKAPEPERHIGAQAFGVEEPERLVGAKAFGVEERPIGAKAFGVEERVIGAKAFRVAAVGATAVGATASGVQNTAQQTSEQEQELERRALEGFKETTEKADPELGAAVQDLHFTPSGRPEAAVGTVGTSAERFEFPASGIQALQVTATAKSAGDVAAVGESTRVVEETIIQTTSEVVTTSNHVVKTPVEPVDESGDDQYLTPEQSLEDNGQVSSSLSKPAAAALGTTAALGTAAALGMGQSHQQSGGQDPKSATNGVGTARTTAAAVSSAMRDGGLQLADMPEGSLEGQQRSLGDLTPVDGADSAGDPSPIVKSRTELFENSEAAAAAEMASLRRGNSYSLSGAGEVAGAQHGTNHLDEFEQADMRKMTTEALSSQPTYAPKATVGCKITRASQFAKKTQSSLAKSTPSATFVRESSASTVPEETPESKSSNEIQNMPEESRSALVREGSGFGEEPMTQVPLEDLLALYPKNPLRTDSQVPLFKILEAIQNLPTSDTEAYAILEQGHGFSKVVVAMLSQYEDGVLQEHGLHCFVRIMRTTPSTQKESLVLSPYADCYRNVQGTADAVVPKGSLGIDERSSGAIQAVIQAMRSHPSIRRVQLAGCAALGEIATVSPSCRSLAYDHGAVTLLVGALQHRSSQAACTIHDTASRAIGSFCGGKENIAFKEAFTSAGAVTELLSVLQLWGHSEDTVSELLTTATKSCCSALRYISDGCPIPSVQCVQSFAYHHLVRTMVLRRSDVSVCTLVVSAMTSITRSAGTVAEKGLQDAKPLREVLITMQAHSDQPLFIRKSLDFMEALGCYSSMREEIVAAGGIPFAADIIQQGGNDSLLLERACGVVEKLCRSNAKNQELFAGNNGVLSLTSLLKTHQGVPSVVEKDLLALSSVCANNGKTQKEAVKVGTPDQVVRSLGTYSSKNSKVAAASAATMAALVVPRNAATAQSFAKLKAPELVVRAMKRHPDSVMVQENGSAAISSFCEADPRIISMLLKSGISSVLVIALHRFLHKQTAVVQIVRAMRAISNEASDDSYRFKSKLLTDRSNESSLSEIFHTALSYHKKSLPETANVIISICATINRLCMRSVAFKNEIGKDGIVEELKRLVEKTAEYKDLGALQPVLATICTLVLDSEDNKNRFHAVGGVEAILDVMQKWKSDTYVLEHCCAALRYSCNEHFGNCDEVKQHNGVRSILGVMELHPENVNVTLWCCLTLADLCKGDEELQSSPNVVQGIRKVVSAMSMFSSNSRFLASACEFLRAASVDNVDNQERIVRLGGRTAIVRALETHPADNTLTEAAAYALLQIQDVHEARSSVDSEPQVGFVKRISRDLRRSSSSNRSNRSGRMGILGRKSLSFSARRRPTEDIEEDTRLTQTVGNEAPPERTPTTRPSLINFSRRSKGSSRNGRRVEVEELGAGDLDGPEQYAEDADDAYGEYDPAPVPVDGSDPQID